MLKTVIRHHLNFVEATRSLSSLSVWHEEERMDCVAAFCEFFAEFEPTMPLPAVSWINRDADFIGRRSEIRCQMSERKISLRWLNDKSKRTETLISTSDLWQKSGGRTTLAIAAFHLNLAHLNCKGGKEGTEYRPARRLGNIFCP